MVKKDSDLLDQILAEFPQIPAICLDVANGYSEHFVDFVKEVRTRHPDHILMVIILFAKSCFSCRCLSFMVSDQGTHNLVFKVAVSF